MKRDRRMLWVMMILAMAAGFPAMNLFAEETASETPAATSATDWKQEFSSDKAAIKIEKEQMKADSSAARQEENALHRQIKQALKSGDTQTAESLKAQLKTMHQENIQQKEQDKKDLKAARQEMRSDKKEARAGRRDANRDGTVDSAERARDARGRGNRDKDNNPPGPRGGPGTNWENRPGPQGGPGASPHRSGNQGSGGERGGRRR